MMIPPQLSRYLHISRDTFKTHLIPAHISSPAPQLTAHSVSYEPYQLLTATES